MATITGYTAAKEDELHGDQIVDGEVTGDNLILTKRDGSTIDAGNVRGATGAPGADGADAAPGDVNPTANTTPIRDTSGRVKGFTPASSDDLTTKAYTDAADTAAITAAEASAATTADTKDTAKIAAFLAADQTFAGKVTAAGFISGDDAVSVIQTGSLLSTTSTSNQNMNGAGLVFVAPASGCVVINLTQYLKSGTAGVYAMAGLIVRAGGTVGSGTAVYTNSAILINANTQWTRAGGAVLVTGLTPGSTYNVLPCYHSDTAGTSISASAYDLVVNPTL
jgi:hypothetical protein